MLQRSFLQTRNHRQKSAILIKIPIYQATLIYNLFHTHLLLNSINSSNINPFFLAPTFTNLHCIWCRYCILYERFGLKIVLSENLKFIFLSVKLNPGIEENVFSLPFWKKEKRAITSEGVATQCCERGCSYTFMRRVCCDRPQQ